MRPVLRLLTCLVLLLCLLTSCGRGGTPPPAASAVLDAMTAAMTASAQPVPDGLTYIRSADPTAPDHLTDTLFSALFGEAARGLLTSDPDEGGAPPIGDAALFLSLAPYPCELAVFRCSDLRTAATVASLCRSRLDTVAAGYRGTEWADMAAGGRVAVEGCYVLLAVAEDPEAVLAGARALLP